MSRITINPSIDTNVSSFLSGDDLREAKRQLLELSKTEQPELKLMVEQRKFTEVVLNSNTARQLRAKNGNRTYQAGIPEIDPSPLSLMSAEATGARINEALRLFFDEVIKYNKSSKEGQIPKMLLCATAGTGKSTKTLENIKRIFRDGMRFSYLAPTLKLAHQVHYILDILEIPSMVIRGRDQPIDSNYPDAEKMCQNSINALEITKMGFGITETLCKSKEGKECEFFNHCQYNKQKEQIKNFSGVLIGAHNYNQTPIDGMKNVDLLIVDEAHDHLNQIHTRVKMRELFSDTRFVKFENDQQREDCMSMLTLMENVFYEKRERPLLISDFINAGITANICEALKKFEYNNKPQINITPDMSSDQQQAEIKKLKKNKALKNARLWQTLAEQINKVHMQYVAEIAPSYKLQTINIILGEEDRKTGAVEDIIHVYYSRDSSLKGVPLLLLDASANVFSAKKYWDVNDCDIVDINSQYQNTHITQIASQSFSHKWLGNSKNSDAIFELALSLAIENGLPLVFDDNTSQKLRDRRGVVIVPKSIKEVWIETKKYNEIDNNLPFVVMTWNALRGLDHGKFCSFELVVGRTEPTVSDIEILALCQHGNELEDFTLIEPTRDSNTDKRMSKKWVKEIAYHKLANSMRIPIEVNSHPDPRIDRILRQKRDDEVSQGIARARAVYRTADNPVQIIVCGNLALDIEIDELSDWSKFEPSKTQFMLNRGFLPVNLNTTYSLYQNLYLNSNDVNKDRQRTVFKCAKNELGEKLQFAEIIEKSFAGYKNIFRVDYKKQGLRGATNEIAFIVQKYENETAENIIDRVCKLDERAFDIRLTGLAG